ncbi:hypothetical protein [Chroococcidiopsis cubana]|uniref:hypothetical protein n=1 Tax=Chroococcidiopsis cubana TaxID=171392 RepID=UPI000F8D7D3E|nr:hypothetical protein [Chroococcidiopsis cubana]
MGGRPATISGDELLIEVASQMLLAIATIIPIAAINLFMFMFTSGDFKRLVKTPSINPPIR